MQLLKLSVMNKVGKSFIFPDEERSSVPYNCFEIDLPIIDLPPVLRLDKLQADVAAGVESTEATREEILLCQTQIVIVLQT